MTTDLFLGGLASLILVAIIIVTLTTNNRREISDNNDGFPNRSDKGRKSKSDR
ncbi:MAG: hypothetical protein HKP51_03310 [Sulfitobacter sp.]|nr:hypothetical protein [Sulfitobacter sp.]